jgi:hypothetical protein
MGEAGKEAVKQQQNTHTHTHTHLVLELRKLGGQLFELLIGLGGLAGERRAECRN